MKRENFLFGCDGIKRFFSGLVSEGILSHAYLIEGPEGSGKKSLAKYIAASLACGKNCDDCNICHRISEGHCPDVKFISLLDNESKLDFAVRLSGGAAGKAVKLLSDGEKEFAMFLSAKSIIDAQSKKNRGVSEYDMLGIVSKAMTGRDEADMLFSMLASAYRDVLSSKMTGNVTGGFFTEDEAEKYVLSLPMETLKKSVEAVTMLSADSNFNFNMTLAASALSVLLWRAA